MLAIHNIKLNDRNGLFLISDFRPEEILSITVLDVENSDAFCGSINGAELKTLAAKIRINFNTFVEVTRNALSQNEYDGLQFLYSLEKNCQGYVFKWQGVDHEKTKVTFGVINVSKTEFRDVIRDALQHLCKELFSLNQKIISNEAELRSSMEDKKATQQLLAEALNVKEKIEMELYSKFVLVINEKKRKIRELIQDSPYKKAKNFDPRSLKVSRMKVHQISDSDSDAIDDVSSAKNDPSTDEEEVNNKRSKSRTSEKEVDFNKAGPSNLKPDTSLLFSDEDEPKVTISPSKVRVRKVANVPVVSELAERVLETYSKIYDSDGETEASCDLLDQM